MKRKDERRPLLLTFSDNHRKMLQEIRDNLSHLQRNQNELTQSTPDLLDKSGNVKTTRTDYHQKALAEIRKSLKPYANSDAATVVVHYGVDVDNSNAQGNKQVQTTHISVGYDEVSH